MKAKAFFFWWEAIKDVGVMPFWWIAVLIFIFLFPITRTFWWILAPLVLLEPLRTYYLWWVGWDKWYFEEQEWIMLEVIPPKEILTPLTAMEDVFSVVWNVADKANWREIWCEGELPIYPFWFSWEIVSIEGKIHFFLRCLSAHRTTFESALYAHYSDLEIRQVADYTKLVPKNVPNADWDMYGEDYVLRRENAYPIKTYAKFFEPQGERIAQEEKRIDPIFSLLESMSNLGSGEHFWLQFISVPFFDIDNPWRQEAKKVADKIARRPEKKKSSWLLEFYKALATLIFGAAYSVGHEEPMEESMAAEKTEEGEREMLLTPGERETLTAIEDKLKKNAYLMVLRGIYVAKKENWDGANSKLARGYISHFGSANLNFMGFDTDSRPKIHFLMRKSRKLYRQRKMMENALLRFPPFFPEREKGASIFSIEEMATLFHFPTRLSGTIAPTTSRVEAKKGGPPINLPIEE